MKFYIKEWPDSSATLMTDTGNYLYTFNSLDVAKQVCKDWYHLNEPNDTINTEVIIETSETTFLVDCQ